jgi:hypothetical protein
MTKKLTFLVEVNESFLNAAIKDLASQAREHSPGEEVAVGFTLEFLVVMAGKFGDIQKAKTDGIGGDGIIEVTPIPHTLEDKLRMSDQYIAELQITAAATPTVQQHNRES